MDKKEILKALEEIRKQKKRKFTQTAELIINLRNFDVKRQNINLAVEVPHKIKERKVCAFLTKHNSHVDTITKAEFDKYKNKKERNKKRGEERSQKRRAESRGRNQGGKREGKS